jgi:5-methyltetrahydropteroyltriglutamate--homocysteine methyltransferase
MMELSFREQFSDALAVVVSDQERAGLDIVTTGDYHCDEDFFGRSWVNYPLERLEGLEGDFPPPVSRWDLKEAFPPGTLLHEIFTGWRGPHAVRSVEASPDRLEYARIWRLAQARTRRSVKFGTVSAQALVMLAEPEFGRYLSDKRRELLWDLSVAMNSELKTLAAAGCQVIQIEEPNFHFFDYPFDADDLDFLIDAFNREVEGLGDVEVWVHTCFGNPNMQRVFKTTRYREEAVEIYLDRLNVDVLTVEMKDRHQADLEAFARYRDSTKKKLAIGVVSHRTLQVETPDEVAADVRNALSYLNAENLVLSSDCGFGRQGCNRNIAFYKAAAIAQGANIVRRELGLPEAYVPAADPELQVEVLSGS